MYSNLSFGSAGRRYTVYTMIRGALKTRHVQLLLVLGTCVLFVVCGLLTYVHYWNGDVEYKTPAERDVYVRFDMEAYDAIATNYWKKASDADLAQFFALSLQKAAGLANVPSLATSDRSGTALMLKHALDNATSTTARRELAKQVVMVALFNLQPIGRDELLSEAQKKELTNAVSNINTNKDLYQNLGLATGASSTAIETAYAKKMSMLTQATSSDVAQQKALLVYAHDVLKNPNTKALYDSTKIEPTVFSHVIGNTLYVYINKIAPTTLQEFGIAVENASTTPLSSLVLDLRGNVGGDLSFATSFLGLFVGQNQYAFDLFHQGDYQVQRTTLAAFPELARYRSIAILTDNMTQSTAELTTAAFRKYHLATVVGTRTRGWGSVENGYPLTTTLDDSTSYTLLLVSHLTLRDDGQPIESNGVVPDVDTTNKNWTNQLADYIHSPSLITAVKQSLDEAPAHY